MYTGHLKLTCQNIGDVYRAAAKLGMQQPWQQCHNILTGKANYLMQSVYLYTTARKLGEHEAAVRNLQVMANHFERIAFSKEFLDLTLDEVCEYLSHDCLAVRSEIIVYLAALKWLCAKFLDRETYIVRVLSCVRFPLMSLDEILASHRPPILPGITEMPETKRMLLKGTCFVAAKVMGEEKHFAQYGCCPRRSTVKRTPVIPWDTDVFEPEYYEEYRKERAAALIQAYYRGYKLRKDIKRRKELKATKTIQISFERNKKESEKPVLNLGRAIKNLPSTNMKSGNKYEKVCKCNIKRIVPEKTFLDTKENSPLHHDDDVLEGIAKLFKGEEDEINTDLKNETEAWDWTITSNDGFKVLDHREVSEPDDGYQLHLDAIFTRCPRKKQQVFIHDRAPKESLGPISVSVEADNTLVDAMQKQMRRLCEIQFQLPKETRKEVPIVKVTNTCSSLPKLNLNLAFPTMERPLAPRVVELEPKKSLQQPEVVETKISETISTEKKQDIPDVKKLVTLDRYKQAPTMELLLVMGGYEKTGHGYDCKRGGTIYAYFPGLNKWSVFGVMEPVRHNFCAVFYEGCIYCIGGCNPQVTAKVNDLSAEAACYRFHLQTKAWSQISSLNECRIYHSAAVVLGRIYVVGGKSQRGRILDSIEYYSKEDDSWIFLNVHLNRPKYGVGVCCFNNELLIVGGLTEDRVGDISALAETESYDPSTNRMHQKISKLPYACGFAALIRSQEELYVIGGLGLAHQGNKKLCSLTNVYFFDGEANKWISTTPLPTARHDVSAVTHGQSLFLAGSLSTVDSSVSNEVLVYNKKIPFWRQCTTLPQKLIGYIAITIPNLPITT